MKLLILSLTFLFTACGGTSAKPPQTIEFTDPCTKKRVVGSVVKVYASDKLVAHVGNDWYLIQLGDNVVSFNKGYEAGALCNSN